MVERQPGGYEQSSSKGITRREFLRTTVAAAAGLVVGSTIESGSDKEVEEQAARMVIMGDLRELKVPRGSGIDAFYHESGWSDEYRLEVYEKAVVLANKGVDVYDLHENQTIKIPYKIKE